MYCLVQWTNKSTSIENSDGVNFKGRQTMIRHSKDGKSYRGRALAMCDDKKFLERISIGTRCCLIIPSENRDNRERNNARNAADGEHDHTRASHVKPGSSGGKEHCQENSFHDNRDDDDVQGSQNKSNDGIEYHRPSNEDNDNRYCDHGAHGSNNAQNVENYELQAVESVGRKLDSNAIFIIDTHDDDGIILMDETLDFDEDSGEDVDNVENNDILNVTDSKEGVNGDEDGREVVHVDNNDISILLSNEEGPDGGENKGDNIDIGHNGVLLLANDGEDFDEGGDEDGDVYSNESDEVPNVTNDGGDFDEVGDEDGDVHSHESEEVPNVTNDEEGLEQDGYRREDFDLDTNDISILVSDGEVFDEDEGGEEDVLIVMNEEDYFDEARDLGEEIDDDDVHNDGILHVRDDHRALDDDTDRGRNISAHYDVHQPGPSHDSAETNPWNVGGRYRVEIMANTDVYIDKRELENITEKYGENPREMERKLFLEILGKEAMITMTRTGRHRSGQTREKFPQEVFDAVRDYMDDKIENNPMSKSEFQEVLTCLCNRLRNPRR